MNSPIRFFVVVWLAFTALQLPAQVKSGPKVGESARLSASDRLRQVTLLIERRQFGRAESEIRSILSDNPKDYQAWDLLGVVLSENGHYGEAEGIFQRTIKERPDMLATRVNLGLLYVRMERREDALAQFGEVLRRDPDRPDAEHGMAAVFRADAHHALQSGEQEKALSLLMRAKKATPHDPDVLEEFGLLALRMSLYTDASDSLTQVLSIRPEDPQAIYGLGRAQMELGRMQDAEKSFDHYVSLHETDASGHYALGLALHVLQQTDDAEREFQRAVELQPVQTQSYFQLGLLDLERGNLDRATAHFDKVLQRDPKHAGALLGKGQLAFQRKQYREAREELGLAIESDPKQPKPHYYLGLTCSRLADQECSQRELETATQLEKEQTTSHKVVLKLLDPAEAAAVDAHQHE